MNIDIITYDPQLNRSSFLSERLSRCFSDYILIYVRPGVSPLATENIARMIVVAHDSGANIVYGDYYDASPSGRVLHRTIDYQPGSVRDDFDFGGAVLIRRLPINLMPTEFSALYDLRLQLASRGPVVRIPESLSTVGLTDTRTSGEKQFDYVNPNARDVQIEREQVFTAYLRRIDAQVSGMTEQFAAEEHEITASVIIPVLNRERTIADALQSALMQQTNFKFNIIAVDNHSTDRTGEIIDSIAQNDDRVIHLIPERDDLGIGGCWMEAVNSPYCGTYAVQLDSDDLYQSPNTLKIIIDKFREGHYGMVIGSYTLTDINCQTIAPGLIAHREWTDENGMNNALRINGLGAPRAFPTELLRQLPMPNVSYGEDYAAGLRISRQYRIGRIFESLYLCRRWNDNSDANLDNERLNRNNHYKDFIRTMEIAARKNDK